MNAEFAHPPCMNGQWMELSGDIARAMRNILAERKYPELYKTVIGKIRARRLSFWSHHFLLEAAVFDEKLNGVAIGTHVSIFGEEGLTALSGDAPPIHDVSARCGLGVTNEQLAEDYLRFFCVAISGEAGRFQIVESVDELSDPSSLRPDLKTRLSGLRWEGRDRYGAWLFEAVVHYNSCLFDVSFCVPLDGMVSMDSDDEFAKAELLYPWTTYGALRRARHKSLQNSNQSHDVKKLNDGQSMACLSSPQANTISSVEIQRWSSRTKTKNGCPGGNLRGTEAQFSSRERNRLLVKRIDESLPVHEFWWP